MHNNQSSYSRWSWIIALLLALILLWMHLTGNGASNTCCSAPVETAPAAEVMPIEETSIVTEVFNFSASEYDFTSTGDASTVTWAGDNIDSLKALLSGGIKAEGDDASVVLTGSADSEEVKQQKGSDAQAFFGPYVSVDNQITVGMAAPVAMAPAAAKLYFDTGVHRLPADSQATLGPITTWLNNNPSAKAVVSGYHDPTGSLSRNIQLAKKRAQSVYDAILGAGIEADRVEMRKPASVEGTGDLNEARRVEVSIE
ncbi:MAG: OmpA family protein [Methylophilaceae bacterium]